MNVVIRTLLFCTLATTPLLLPAAEGGEQQPTQIPPRLLREVLAEAGAVKKPKSSRYAMVSSTPSRPVDFNSSIISSFTSVLLLLSAISLPYLIIYSRQRTFRP